MDSLVNVGLNLMAHFVFVGDEKSTDNDFVGLISQIYFNSRYNYRYGLLAYIIMSSVETTPEGKGTFQQINEFNDQHVCRCATSVPIR